MPIRIVLADDHYLVREGLAALIGTEPELELVGDPDPADTAARLGGHEFGSHFPTIGAPNRR